MKAALIVVAKFVVAFAILGYLISDIQRTAPDTFVRVVYEPKNWWCMLGALLCYGAALLLGLVRWQMVARAGHLPLRFTQILRLGAFAYAIEVVSIGLTGGDAARATMIARMYPKQAAAALVSVVVDRAIGGFVIFWFASVAAYLVDPQAPAVLAAVGVIQGLGALFITGIVLWLCFPRLAPWAARQSARFGRIGHLVAQIITALDGYRGRLPVLLAGAVLTSFTLLLICTSFYLIAAGLPGGGPQWSEHMVIVPLLLLAALVPMPVQGLGVVDYTLSYLYQNVAALPPGAGQGLLVAMAMRLTSMCLCAIAATIYALLPAPTAVSTGSELQSAAKLGNDSK